VPGKHRRVILTSPASANTSKNQGVCSVVEKPGRTISRHGCTGYVLQQQAGVANIFVKILAALLINQAMSVAVRCNLVPASRQLPSLIAGSAHQSIPARSKVTCTSLAEDIHQLGEVFSTRDGRLLHSASAGALGTSRIWNQSSTSTEKMRSASLPAGFLGI